MHEVLNEVMEFLGLAEEAPATLGELIPMLITVVVSVALISAVFGLIGHIVRGVMRLGE